MSDSSTSGGTPSGEGQKSVRIKTTHSGEGRVFRRPSELVPDPENPRYHTEENIDAIEVSLRAHGQVLPLVVHRPTQIVFAGNGTLEAIKRIGLKMVWVNELDIPIEECRKLGIRLNQSATLAQWDFDVLQRLLKLFPDEDFGFGQDAREALESATESLASAEPIPSEEPAREYLTDPELETDHFEPIVFSVAVQPEDHSDILAAIRAVKGPGTKGEKLAEICRASLPKKEWIRGNLS